MRKLAVTRISQNVKKLSKITATNSFQTKIIKKRHVKEAIELIDFYGKQKKQPYCAVSPKANR